MPRFFNSKLFKLVAAAGIIAAPQTALAQSSAPLSGLYACEALADNAAQLSCFRAETAKLRAAETSGDVIAVEKQTFTEIKDAEVKAEVKKAEVKRVKAEKEKTAKVRTLAIQSTETYGRNDFIRFTLENGEVWQQTEADRVRLGRASPDKLTIKKGSFGGFLARINDKAPSIRVKQVR